MTAARVVKIHEIDGLWNYDVYVGDQQLVHATSFEYAERHVNVINAGLAPLFAQERRKALEEAAKVADSFVASNVAPVIAQSIRSLRGEG